jgi:hypothetical protein
MGSASLGFQAGASAAEVVMIVNSQKALDSLFSNKLKLGADASVALGPKGVGSGAAMSATSSSTRRCRAHSPASRSTAPCSTCALAELGLLRQKATPVEILVKQEVTKPEAAALQAAVKKAAT